MRTPRIVIPFHTLRENLEIILSAVLVQIHHGSTIAAISLQTVLLCGNREGVSYKGQDELLTWQLPVQAVFGRSSDRITAYSV